MATTFPITTDKAEIEVTLEPGTHVLELIVEDSAGNLSAPDTVTITVVGLPAITGFAPSRGRPGTEVQIRGRNFIDVQDVLFARDVGSKYTVVSRNLISATVPAGAVTGPIEVITTNGEVQSEQEFVIEEEISVAIEPGEVRLGPGEHTRFTATVAGTTDQRVEWSASGGTISQQGRYTAPERPGGYQVTATSLADPSKRAVARVAVEAGISVRISPLSPTVLIRKTQQFEAQVSGTRDQRVQWSAERGKIDKEGLYTAPATVGTDRVGATSVADPEASTSTTVTVKDWEITPPPHTTAPPHVTEPPHVTLPPHVTVPPEGTEPPHVTPPPHATIPPRTLRPTPPISRPLGPGPIEGPDIRETTRRPGDPLPPIDAVSGIGPAYVARLREADIMTVDRLAAMEPAELAEILGVTEIRAKGFIEEAKRISAPR